jgi:hypothetical protein
MAHDDHQDLKTQLLHVLDNDKNDDNDDNDNDSDDDDDDDNDNDNDDNDDDDDDNDTFSKGYRNLHQFPHHHLVSVYTFSGYHRP